MTTERTIAKSAETGQIVSEEFAAENPSTTYHQTVEFPSADPEPALESTAAARSAILDEAKQCFIDGCRTPGGIDQRGTIRLRDGSEHAACPPHWEAIFGIVGAQITAEQEEAEANKPPVSLPRPKTVF